MNYEVSIPAAEKQSIILFVGSPGSGKSTFYRQKLQPLGYERINQDTLKTVRFYVSL
jgi:bifunctional polynucleotide phosphatase/kinase